MTDDEREELREKFESLHDLVRCMQDVLEEEGVTVARDFLDFAADVHKETENIVSLTVMAALQKPEPAD